MPFCVCRPNWVVFALPFLVVMLDKIHVQAEACVKVRSLREA